MPGLFFCRMNAAFGWRPARLLDSGEPDRPESPMTPRPLALALLAAFALTPHAVHAAPKAKTKHAAKAKTASAAPMCSDFYQAVNKDWLTANPAPAGAATVSALSQLRDRSIQQQRDLLDQAMNAPQGGVQKALGDFWASGLDEAAVEADGSKPIAPLLARIDGIKRTRDVPAAIAALHQVGIPALFNFSADVDLDDLNRHIGYFTQGGLGLPDPAFYSRTDPDAGTIMASYRQYVRNILTLAGSAPDKVAADTDMVLGVEFRIAQASKAIRSTRDPRVGFAPVPVSSLKGQYRNLQLSEFLAAQGVNDDRVSIADPQLFAQLDAMVAGIPPQQWKAYLRFHVADAMAPYLSRGFRDAEQQFRGRVFRGQSTPPPRWQEVLSAIDVAAGPMLGHEYAARYLPPATKARAEAVAGDVRDALMRAFDRNTWMSAAAKTEAKAKLAKTRIEVGVPPRDLDYTVQPMGRGSFGGNMLIASTWRHQQEMKRIGKGNANRRWSVLPQDPALAYDLAQNRIVVTAAMLQAPVLDMTQPAASHYGSFGALVGEELTHGFDSRGRNIDANGTLRDWWTPADANAWLERLNKVASQYGSYTWPNAGGAHVNGQLTREQDAADIAGVELALDALGHGSAASASDVTAFSNGWAKIWPQQMGPEAAQVAAAASPYSPGQWRANGPLSDLPEFQQAFGCKEGNPMVRPAASRVTIWR